MFLILISVTITLLAIYLHRTFSYWQRIGVPSYPSPSYIQGHIKTPFCEQFVDIYNYFKRQGAKHGGFYFMHQPIYMPIDPDLLKQVLTKDYDYFNQKGLYNNEKKQPINMHLFQIGGERWKKLRVKLTPTFTSGKLKNMFPTIVRATEPLIEKMEELTASKSDIDIKDISSKFTTDVIGSCAFGIECNSFKSTSTDFHHYGKELMRSTFKGRIKRALGMSYPKLSRAFGMVLLSQEIEDFYTNITKDTINYRKDNKVQRNDFLQLLMELENKENPNERITVQEIINQSFVFYIAGFETSSTVMTYALLELSKHPHIQDKVRNEIETILTKNNNEITYDAIQEMKYLSNVVDETLRKYPPVILLNRECSQDYEVPGTDVILEKGTKVFIPVYPLQFDEEYYPNPSQFDPDRFQDEIKNKRPAYTYMPFGEGPRQCIGLRFGLLQTKIGLITLLRKFKFSLHPTVEYPVKYGKGLLTLLTDKTILLESKPL